MKNRRERYIESFGETTEEQKKTIKKAYGYALCEFSDALDDLKEACRKNCFVRFVFYMVNIIYFIVGLIAICIHDYIKGVKKVDLGKQVAFLIIALNFILMIWISAYNFKCESALLQWADPVRYEYQLHKEPNLFIDSDWYTIDRIEAVDGGIKIYLKETGGLK